MVRFDMLLVVLLGFWFFSSTYCFVIISACCFLGCLRLCCVLRLVDCAIVVSFASIFSLFFSQCVQVERSVFLAYDRSSRTVVKFAFLCLLGVTSSFWFSS